MKSNTKEKILKEGRALLQQHGYNGFSFQDIADALKIKKPSLYDHYDSKEALVIAILQNYSEMFDIWTKGVESLAPIQKIRKVFDVFYSFACDQRKVCPVLSLGADTAVLTKAIQAAMKDFVDKWLTWLESQILLGQKSGEIRKDIKAKDLAEFIYSQGMGSQFQARIKGNPELTKDSGDMITSLLKAR